MTHRLNRRRLLAAALAGLLPQSAFAETVIRLPFRMYKGRAPVLPVTLNDKGPFPFIFALSSTLNSIDTDLALELGLKRKNQVANFFLGNQTVSTGSVDRSIDFECESVKVGAYDMQKRVFDSSPRAQAAQAYYQKHMQEPDFPRGTLGTAFFLETPCILDYQLAEFRFYPQDNLDISGFSPLNTKVLDSDLSHNKSVSVSAELNGQPISCWLDTTSNSELYLSSQYVKSHDMYNRFSDFIEHPVNLTDPSKGTVRVVRIKNFRIGSAQFNEINVVLGDPVHSDHLHEVGVKAVIGKGLLQQFSLAFQNEQIFVKANSTFTPISGPYKVPTLE